MSKIVAEISAGELLDKISILEIKLQKIQDGQKRQNVRHEFECLVHVRDRELKNWRIIEDTYLILKDTNERLWEIEDRLRILESEKNFSQEFIEHARLVYYENDKRARLKRMINEKLGSDLIEEKQYVNYSQPSL